MLQDILIKNEDEILDETKRKRIIEEIIGWENRKRKDEHFKRYEVYKDQAWKYVISNLVKQFDSATVDEMAYSISNLSIARKMVDKLARVYSFGANRSILREDGTIDEEATKNIEGLSTVMDFNTQMKKINRFLKLQRNTIAYVKPTPITQDDGSVKYGVKIQALNPYLYDVIENQEDREKPLICILSNYIKSNINTSPLLDAAKSSPNRVPPTVKISSGDNKDQMIADTPSDQNQPKNEFVFWSKKYHFTCDGTGLITSGEDIENPIQELPFCNFAIDQDGAFWAIGGDDLADGSILINSMLTHMNHVGVTQGYGQFYMKGKNLPTTVKLGPNKGIRMEFDKDDPIPEVGFLTANPPLADLRENLIMYVALLLTTNNLSTSGIAATLNGQTAMASGIALVIDKAESMEDTQDQAQVFIDKEKCIWTKVAKWLQIYKSKNLLDDSFARYQLPENLNLSLKLGDPRPIMSEKEKLENLQLRKDLGFNTQVELLMQDDPALTKEQAMEKLKQIAKDRVERSAAMGQVVPNPKDNANSADPANMTPEEKAIMEEKAANQAT